MPGPMFLPGWSLSREVSGQGVSAVADRHSKILDACPPQGPNSFNFMHFWGKFGKIICWGSWRVGAPPRGNPGSATALSRGVFQGDPPPVR